MDTESILKLLVLLIGFYMAWNIGANDVSNAMGTSVGSGALTLRRAVILAALLEFSGAFFAGGNVSETMQKGLIDTHLFLTHPPILVMGMCAALLGTSVWLQIASYFGWPVSTTHAIVGAILGFGAVVGGIDAVQWGEVGSIASSWVISPLIAGAIAYSIFTLLQRYILFAINPTEATRRLFPLFVFIVFFTFTLSLLFNGLHSMHLYFTFSQALTIALLVGCITGAIAYLAIRRFSSPSAATPTPSRVPPQNIISLNKAIKHLQRVHLASPEETQHKLSLLLQEIKMISHEMNEEASFPEATSEYRNVEKMFTYLQILTACFVAFAHGANDVANAIGPVAAVLDIIKNGQISTIAPVPGWLLAFGGVGIVIGLATWGWRVIETIGRKITELTPTRGFSAEFGTATTILVASKLGLPISTTHCLVGAILGVGLARGVRAINLNMIRDIILSWVITIPASALISVLAFYALKALFPII